MSLYVYSVKIINIYHIYKKTVMKLIAEALDDEGGARIVRTSS